MNESNVIVLVIASLFGLFLYQRNRARTAEALLGNEEDKKKLNELDKDTIKNKALLELEEEKRKQIENESNDKKKQSLTLEDINDMFNKLNNRK